MTSDHTATRPGAAGMKPFNKLHSRRKTPIATDPESPLQTTMEEIAERCRQAVPDFDWSCNQPTTGFMTDSWFLKCRQIQPEKKVGLALRLPIETTRELLVLPPSAITKLACEMADASLPIERGAHYPEATATVDVTLHTPRSTT